MLGFGSYYFLARSKKLRAVFESACRHLDNQGNHVLLQRALGLLFLGIFSVLIIGLFPGKGIQEFGLTFSFSDAVPWWTLALVPLVLAISYFTSRTPDNLKQYPQIRARQWTPAMLTINVISWILFLVGYEFLFRGFVLYASLAMMDPVAAIALNTAIYAFAHFYKGPGETFGSIPAGIILCYLTLLTGNIWSAVILHSITALSKEWFSLKAHPEMTLTKVP